MAAYYVDVIASALQEFDNSQQPYQFYKDMAWNGLQGTVAWNNLSDTERTRIVNTVVNNRTNGNMTCNSTPPAVE